MSSSAIGAETASAGSAKGTADGHAPADSGHTHESICLNCGTPLAGSHCHACGQRAHIHRSVAAFLHDLLHGVLHFEGSIWRTAPLLFARPGELTRRYIAGERVRFVSPLALFLFSAFLLFAVLGHSGEGIDQQQAAAEIARMDADIVDLQRQQHDRMDQRRDNQEIDSVISATILRREMLAANSGLPINRPLIDIGMSTGWEALDEAIEKANHNPALMIYKLKSNAYKYSWALIPLSLPFLALMFLHKRRYRQNYGAYDHLVFITYSITFFSLLAVALTLLASLGIPAQPLGLMFVIALPIHFFLQLKSAYRLTVVGALWRTLVLMICAAASLVIFLLLLLLLGLAS